MSSRIIILIAASAAIIGIALGAFGAHALQEKLATAGHTDTWETATRYHLIHAVALFALGVWMSTHMGSPHMARAACFWIAGILLFSGSLYGLSLEGPRWLGPVTPLGGVSFMIGWVFVALAALNSQNPASSI